MNPFPLMNSFCFETGTWKVKWPEWVSQYDIVCLSPPLDPMQGLPLGNGDLGALVWCEPQRLILAVNKCDLWDDSPDTATGGFNEDAPYWEDRWTALRHACRLEFRTPDIVPSKNVRFLPHDGSRMA